MRNLIMRTSILASIDVELEYTPEEFEYDVEVLHIHDFYPLTYDELCGIMCGELDDVILHAKDMDISVKALFTELLAENRIVSKECFTDEEIDNCDIMEIAEPTFDYGPDTLIN